MLNLTNVKCNAKSRNIPSHQAPNFLKQKRDQRSSNPRSKVTTNSADYVQSIELFLSTDTERMEHPMRQCVFCLDLLEEGAAYRISSTLLSSVTHLCFQQHPDQECLQTAFANSIEEASYCSLCCNKVTEIYDVQKNLLRIQERLTQLASTLDTYVMEKYRNFNEETIVAGEESSRMVQLRKELFIFKLSGSVEDSKTDYYFPENKLSSLSTYSDLILLGNSDLLEVGGSATSTSSKIKRRSRTAKLQKRTPKIPVLCIPKISLGDSSIKTESEEETNRTRLSVSHIQCQSAFPKKMATNRKTQSNTKTKLSTTTRSSKALRCTYAGCTRTFPRESRRFAHIRRVHGEGSKTSKRFACEECGSCLNTPKSLEIHRRRYHGYRKEESAFPCTVTGCTKTFSQEAVLYGHIKRFHEGLTIFKCSHCDKVCSKASKLRIHERMHTGELPFECTICQKRFSAGHYLKQHSNLHNDKYRCNICGKSCTTQASLQHHRNTHSALKPFICELCGYTCTTKQSLEFHQANQHEGTTNMHAIKCHVCGKYLSSKTSLQSHLISIHKIGEGKFPCPHCSSTWTNPTELRKHVNNIHLNLKKYECMICNKKFGTQANVRRHHQAQHVPKEERERPFECPICYRRFYEKKTLDNHVVIHTSERPFPCELCDKRFPSKSYLDLHIFTVHNKRKRKSESNNPNREEEKSVINDDGQGSMMSDAGPTILGNQFVEVQLTGADAPFHVNGRVCWSVGT